MAHCNLFVHDFLLARSAASHVVAMQRLRTEIHAALKHFKSHVWKNFGFHNLQGKNEIDMSHAFSKICYRKVKYCGNTTNIRAHISRHHPELSDKTAEEAKAANSKQQTLDTCFSKLPNRSEKAILPSIINIHKIRLVMEYKIHLRHVVS